MTKTSSPILARYRWLEEELATLYGAFRYSSAIGLKLERIEQLLGLIGNPERELRIIHVGGTSGKGSTATMIANILEAAGYRVGLHTSPHLQIVNERHRIDGRWVSTTSLSAAWQALKPAVEEVRATSPFGGPSYFEVQVALSLLLFRAARVDFAVVEVGVGGRIDPTNVVPAEVAVLTNVGLDHTEILGDTVEEIAQDKAGIIKKGQRVISGVTQPTVQAIIRGRCRQKGAQLWLLGEDFRVDPFAADGCHLYLPGRTLRDVRLGMQGRFQAANAALAAAAVLALGGVELPDEALRRGLAASRLAGRVERVQERPLVLLDGAHNPDKIRASTSILEQIDRRESRIITVMALKKGKDAAEIVPPAVSFSDEVILTTFSDKGLWRALEPAQLAELVADAAPGLPREIEPDAAAAVDLALERARPQDVVWVTGSLYLAGEVRSRWFPLEEMLLALEDRLPEAEQNSFL